MIALFAALSLAAAPAPTLLHPGPIQKLDPMTRLSPAACAMETRRIGGATSPGLHKLTDLPPADLEIAMVRIDRSTGCQAPVIVSYGAGR